MPFARFGAAIALAVAAAAAAVSPVHAQQRGGTLQMVVQPEPPTLASYLSTANPAGVVGSKIYEGLLEYDFQLNPLPSLAKSWSVSPDGKAITFNLQPGVKFHDGKEFTSADVQFTIMEVLKKYHPRGQITFKDVQAVDTPQPDVAVIRLAHPAPYIMRALSGYESPMIPKHLFQGSDIATSPNANKPVGTGPFKFVEWKRGQYIRLDRNADYWKQGRPYMDRIVMRFIGDAATRVAAIEKGEVDYGALSAVPNIDVARVSKDPSIASTTKGNEVINPMVDMELNTRRKPFDNPKVRQALAYAMDRDFIVQNIWYGFGKPATGPLHSSLKATGLYTTEGMPNFQRNDRFEYAAKLLDEAGLKPGADGVRFEFTLDVIPFGQEWRRLGEYLQQSYAKVGVKMNLRYEDFPTFLRRVFTNYDFDAMTTVTFLQADPVVGTHRLYHSRSIQKGTIFVNCSQWSSPKTDQLMDQATIENNPEKRKALYHELQRELAASSSVIWINELSWVTVHNKRVADSAYSPLGVFSSFDRTSLAK